MSRIIKTDEGELVKRRWGRPVIVAVIAVLIVGGGVAAASILTKKHTSPTASSNGVQLDQGALEADTRSDVVKIASQTATNQAANGNSAGAISTLNEAVKATGSTDEQVSLYYQLASVNADAGNKDAAIAAEQSAIRLQPNNWRVYKNAGSIYAQLGDTATAQANYAKALDLVKGTDDYTANHIELQGLASGAIQ